MLLDARDNSLRFAWVLPGVLAGCRKPDDRSDYRLLVDEGVRTVVSLLEWNSVAPFASEFSLEHARFPILDGAPPDLAQLEEFVQLVETRGPACVHCYAGIGRTGCMLCGFLVRARAFDPVQAMVAVERSRVYSFQTDAQERWILGLTPRLLPGH
jgi:hypothetical protein